MNSAYADNSPMAIRFLKGIIELPETAPLIPVCFSFIFKIMDYYFFVKETNATGFYFKSDLYIIAPFGIPYITLTVKTNHCGLLPC